MPGLSGLIQRPNFDHWLLGRYPSSIKLPGILHSFLFDGLDWLQIYDLPNVDSLLIVLMKLYLIAWQLFFSNYIVSDKEEKIIGISQGWHEHNHTWYNKQNEWQRQL